MLNRREILLAGAASFGALTSRNLCAAETQETQTSPQKPQAPFRLLLNMGTLIGYDLDVEAEIDVAAQAGYDGVELWMMRIERFQQKGGKLADLRKRLEDAGLTCDSAIGFPAWLVDDETRRAEGVRQITREMEILAELGCKNIAAPAAGVSAPLQNLEEAGERYRVILEIGRKIGVRPLLEIWGSSPALSKVSTAAAVAVAAGHEDAALLLDAFHMYKGGNRFACMRMLNGRQMPIFHLNDYPAEPSREKITDADRVFPGDGVCPLKEILATLREIGFAGGLSLELFNRTYWDAHDPLTVAKTGLEKMKTLLAGA